MKIEIKTIFLFMTFLCVSCNTKVVRPSDIFSKNSERISAALNNNKFNWKNINTLHFNIHYLPDKWTPERVDSVSIQMEICYDKNIHILGETNYNNRIDVFLVGPKSDVGIIAGQSVTAEAMLPERAVAHSNSRLSTRPEILQHELMHVLSFDIWGIPQDFFMSEGIATFAYGTAICGYNFDPIANYLLKNNYLPSLEQVTNDFFKYKELITHYSGASFIKFVDYKYGISGVRILWKEGIIKGSIHLGTNVFQIDQEWRVALQKSVCITGHDLRCLENDCVDTLNNK
jgi:hypothetical protein